MDTKIIFEILAFHEFVTAFSTRAKVDAWLEQAALEGRTYYEVREVSLDEEEILVTQEIK